jgi:hypothetical protein
MSRDTAVFPAPQSRYVRVMKIRLATVLASVGILAGASDAVAAGAVTPRAGILLSGTIHFPRAQAMTLRTDRQDRTKLRLRLGFDGRCRGGKLAEVWAAQIAARPTARVVEGHFVAELTGTARNVGGVQGRTAQFTWQVSGRFVKRDAAVATIAGSAVIKEGDRVTSRCRIAKPASVRLAPRRS